MISIVPVESVIGNNVEVELNAIADRLRTSHRTHIESALQVGADLMRAKDILPHGEFLPWVERELRWSERAARRYMMLASALGKTANLADLQLGTAYELAAAPEPARLEVLSRISAGERVAALEIKAIVREAKAAEQHFKRPARGSGGRKMEPEALVRRQAREQREEVERQARWAAQKASAQAAYQIIAECLGERLSEVAALLREGRNETLASELERAA